MLHKGDYIHLQNHIVTPKQWSYIRERELRHVKTLPPKDSLPNHQSGFRCLKIVWFETAEGSTSRPQIIQAASSANQAVIWYSVPQGWRVVGSCYSTPTELQGVIISGKPTQWLPRLDHERKHSNRVKERLADSKQKPTDKQQSTFTDGGKYISSIHLYCAFQAHIRRKCLT